MYIFSRYSHMSNIRENMYSMKISITMSYSVKNIKNANLNPRENAYFLEFAKMYVRENVYVHSI